MRTGTGRPVDQSVKRDRTYFTFTNYALNFCIDYTGEDFKKVKDAVREFIKSLGEDNKCYYRDENIIIEVE